MDVALGINRRLPINLTPSLIERFHAAVERRGPDECWPWNRSPRNGYGAIRHEGHVLSAHRVAYVIANGEPADGLIVTHQCDNRICCNPAHLRAATPEENVREAIERRRRAPICGTMSPRAVLNDQLVAEIWKLRRTGMGTVKIAQAMGLNKTTVKGVVEFRRWKHLIPDWAQK